MRNKLIYTVTGLLVLLGVLACSEHDKYETSVVKQIELFLDDEGWAVNTGASNKPLFVYNADGSYHANYSSLYRFQLPNGSYKIISSTQSAQIPQPDNLNDMVVPQDPEAKQKFDVSAPVDYASPFDDALSVRMYTRTGVLRLRATDKKSDRSYTTVRAVVSTPISGYKVSDASFVLSPMEIVCDRATTTGGVNYSEDMVLFETNSSNEAVSIRIDYLDKNNAVVQSKAIDGKFAILPNQAVQIDFSLNNENEPIIQDYTVTLLPEEWTQDEITPEIPMKIPEGYIYVNPEENLETICKNLMADASVNEVKLFLKAGESYALGRQTDMPKSLYIMGEKPQDGQSPAYMTMGNMSISTDGATIDGYFFENLTIKVTDSDFFKFKNQYFHVKDMSFKNCEISDLGRTMWYQEVNAPLAQVLDRLTIDNCRFYNLDHSRSGFIGLSTKQDAPIYNIVMRNSTFHAKDLTKPLLTGFTVMTGSLDITIENCTFYGMGPAGMSFFDLRANNTSSFTLNVKNNLFSGVSTEGSGQWFNLGNVTQRSLMDNYHTSDFVLATWGVEDGELPIVTTAKDALFIGVDSFDFTIKDTSSEVYTKRIGDPHWIK